MSDLLLVELGQPPELPQFPLPFGILSLQVLNPSDPRLQLSFIIIDLLLKLSVILLALINLPLDIFFEGEGFPSLFLNSFFELSDFLFIQVGFPSQSSMD